MPRHRHRTLPLLALGLLTLLVALPAAAQAKVRIGVGDQKPEIFNDARFRQLGIKDARFLIPWDAALHRSEVKEADAWLQAAHDAHVQPLISFTRSRQKGKGQKLPTVHRYKHAFKRFRRHWPWVRNYSIWNEPNLCAREPTCHHVKRVTRYYQAARRTCHRCRILAGELLDFPNMAHWVELFEKRLGHKPMLWGVHDYRDANRRQTRSTRALLKATKAKIWITETGGLVRHGDKPSHFFHESVPHAAKVTRFIFHRILRLSHRIKRVYLYNWSVPTHHEIWDSAFIGPHGPRPSYRILKRQVKRLYPRRTARALRRHSTAAASRS